MKTCTALGLAGVRLEHCFLAVYTIELAMRLLEDWHVITTDPWVRFVASLQHEGGWLSVFFNASSTALDILMQAHLSGWLPNARRHDQQVMLEVENHLKSGNSKDCFLVGVGVISQWILPFFGDVTEAGSHGDIFLSQQILVKKRSLGSIVCPKQGSQLGLIGAHPVDVEMCTADAAGSLAVVSLEG